MKLALITFLLAAATALPNAEPEAEPLNLEKRACSYETGCRSKLGVAAGRYCGYCPQVQVTWVSDHVCT
jgi:hypothetical protein